MFLFFFSLALIVQRIEHGIADSEMEVRFLLRAQGGCRGHGIVVITSGFQPEDRGSIPLARSEISIIFERGPSQLYLATRSYIMKFTLNQQTATISFAIIFMVAIFFYADTRTKENVIAEPEATTSVAEISDGFVTSDIENIPTPEPESVDIENTPAPDVTETPPFLDSLDEDALGKEFENIQAGIDLLNNPLR